MSNPFEKVMAQGAEVTTLQGMIQVGMGGKDIVVIQINTLPGKIYQFPMDRLSAAQFAKDLDNARKLKVNDISGQDA